MNAKAITTTMAMSLLMAGREVVQLYASAPGKTMRKPVRELRAFSRDFPTFLQKMQPLARIKRMRHRAFMRAKESTKK